MTQAFANASAHLSRYNDLQTVYNIGSRLWDETHDRHWFELASRAQRAMERQQRSWVDRVTATAGAARGR